MSWNDIKKKYGNNQTSNTSSNNNSSWQRIKNKYSQMEASSSSSNTTSSTQSSSKNKTSLWDTIKNWAKSAGDSAKKRTTYNSSGVANKNTQKVLNASNISNSDKAMYIASQKSNSNNETEDTTFIDWQNLGENSKRVGENILLGGSSGIKQGLNFSFITADERNKTEQQVKNQRVLGSKELSNSDKATYIASQNNKSTTENNVNLPTIKLPTSKTYDKDKVEDIANYSVLDKSIQEDQKKIQENIDQQTDVVTKKLSELAPSIGNMGVGAVASAINPALGTVYFTTSAGGSYMQDALDRGMSRKEAVQYGKIMGTMEGVTEAISWGTISKAGQGLKAIIKGTGKSAIKETAEAVAKTSIKSVLKDYGIGIAENAIQEAIIEPIQEVVASNIGGEDKASWDNMGERMLKSAIDGALTSALVGGADLGIESCIGVVEKIQNGENITQQEVKTALEDASKQLNVEEIITDTVQQETNKISSEQTNPYRNTAKAKKLIKEKNNQIRELQSQIEQTDSLETKNELQAKMQQVESEYNNKIQELYDNTNEYANLQQNGTNNQNNANKQQITQQENKNVQTGISEQTKTILPMPNEKMPISTENRLKKAIKDSINNKSPKGTVTLGNVSEKISKKISDILGINVSNRRHTLAKTDIRHMLNEHGNPEIELQKGQIAITEEDILKIPDIIENYDDIVQGSNNKQGKTIRYIKSFSDNTSYVVEVVPENSGTLNIKTMWKKPTALTNSQTTLDSTSETTDSSISSTTNTIIPQNTSNMQVQEKTITRHEVIQNNRKIARENIKNISTWKDKNKGLSYQLETMERNMFDIIPNKSEAQNINDTYFEPIHESEAQKQKFINKYNDRIKEFNLNKYESEAVQVLGEYKYNPDFKTAGVDIETNKTVLDKIKENIKKGRVDEQKVNEAIEAFREIYDELFELENKALRENGYQEKPYRKGYFPHFIDYVPETRTEKVLNALGFKIDKRPLPTDIAGITEQFVPGKTWNRSALERKTNKTDYNALKGFDTYIAQAADNIFHTENIQRLRGLENEIRYQYSDKGIQKRIDEILNDDSLYEDEKQDLIDRIYEQIENPMPNLVTELRRYTNALANKKSEADRSIENKIGRPIYSTVNAIENRFAANAVGLNIGSALTNFIPITQAYSQVSTGNMNRAIIDTVKSYVTDDGFVDKSTFLTNRLSQAEKLYKTKLEKASDIGNILFNAIDDVTSNIIVRGKYLENINSGMNEIDAMKDADAFARKVIADRSKGSLPTIFEEKNPITKMFTQFQLEVNNQYRYMFKDIPRDLAEKGLRAIALAFFKMFVGAWLYNKVSEKITGRKPAFSPIDIVTSAYETITDNQQSTADKIINISTDVLQDVPFVGGLVGGGRVPVNGAIPNAENLLKASVGLATGEMDSKKALNTIGKEVSKPLYYLLPPFGGGQIKKSIEGIKTVAQGGSYGIDSKGEKTLQFPVNDTNASNYYVKAGLFGKYSLPSAQEYVNRGYKSLSAKQTKTYEESNLPYKEYLEYIEAGLKKTKDKINYLESKDMTIEQKWGIYKNDLFGDTIRESDGGSQLQDAEYITANGVSKSEYIKLYNKAKKNEIDMPTADEYKEMKTNNISLSTYIDYKIKVKNLTERKRNSNELSKDENLKNADKIQILLDSNFSDKEISSMYASYIKSEKDTEYDIMKSAGIDIKEYLKYKQQDFESDYYDDGTLTGKTVSKSKQKKIVAYLNSMKIKGNQRLLLYAMQGYSMTSSQKTQLANYVNSLKIDRDTKLKLYDKFSGFKVYKNGQIRW